MAPRASTVRPTSAWATVQTLLLMTLFWFVAATLVGEWTRGLAVGAVTYLLYRVLFVRFVVCRHHRRGVSLTNQGRFADAIAAFQRSEAFWARWRWLDRSRGILLGSAVAWPFELLARYNQAYCHSRLGQGAEAMRLLQALRAEHPDMRIAAELLDVLEAGASARAPAPAPAHDETWGGMLEDEPSMAPAADPAAADPEDPRT